MYEPNGSEPNGSEIELPNSMGCGDSSLHTVRDRRSIAARGVGFRMIRRLGRLAIALFAGAACMSATAQDASREDRFRTMSQQAEAQGLAEPFKGVTTAGAPQQGLFPVRATGVSTGPVREAAVALLAALSDPQRKRTTFAVDDDEWRKWMNQSFYVRQGVSFKEMTEAQREAAFGLMRASLSAKGLKLSRDIMKLNHTLGELNNDNFDEYGEWLYWITVMGEPSANEPWGWQLDGHHLIINYFVLGDQVVMTPSSSAPSR